MWGIVPREGLYRVPQQCRSLAPEAYFRDNSCPMLRIEKYDCTFAIFLLDRFILEIKLSREHEKSCFVKKYIKPLQGTCLSVSFLIQASSSLAAPHCAAEGVKAGQCTSRTRAETQESLLTLRNTGSSKRLPGISHRCFISPGVET